MPSINDLTLAKKLTARVAEVCQGLEFGSAPILYQVSATTAELLKWWFQEDFKDTRGFNFHEPITFNGLLKRIQGFLIEILPRLLLILKKLVNGDIVNLPVLELGWIFSLLA